MDRIKIINVTSGAVMIECTKDQLEMLIEAWGYGEEDIAPEEDQAIYADNKASWILAFNQWMRDN